MPLVTQSDYKPPFWLKNPHANTIYAGLVRRVQGIAYERERIYTPDDDFMDLDWSRVGGEHLLIALHGLEGAADRPYITGLIKHANMLGFDGVGMNFRFCSGEPNRQLRVYHSGATDDLEVVVQHILQKYSYKSISLVGYSLGGNVVLKYVGERGSRMAPRIRAAVGVSVPCDLLGTQTRFEQWDNRAYVRRFLDSLRPKVAHKRKTFPDAVDYDTILKVRTIWDFDDMFTGPVHGFEGARDYYTRCSSRQFLPEVKIPTLLLNALDDSFLGEACYPYKLAKEHPLFYLETPRYGGHVGFVTFGEDGLYWSEKRVLDFVGKQVL